MRTWLTMTATDLGNGIGAGEIDPLDLTETYLEAILAHPLRDRIYARVTEIRARGEAMAASKRAKSGQRLGPLDGVPVSWKDLFDTAGIITEAGTAMMRGRVPDRDAAVLRQATAQGLICLGKTHMSEIAFSGLGYNPVTETPPCVNDANAVAGGSSSGAATSVAFNLAALAIGSDTGGSVRIPAAWNDLVGFKPTHGALSLQGVVPLCKSFDTVGPLCRSVQDATHAFAAMGGASIDLAGSSLKGKRFAIVETIAFDTMADAPGRAFEKAVTRITAAGAYVERIDVPCLRQAFDLTGTLYVAEAHAFWRDYLAKGGDKMYDRVHARVLAGQEVLATDYISGWDKLHKLRLQFAHALDGYDAVLCPSSSMRPPNIERLAKDEAYYVATNLEALRNTRIGNLMGMCGLTLPTGAPSCGVMLMGLAGRDAQLLRLSVAAEHALA